MSCDEPDVLKEFVKARKWTSVEHYSLGWHKPVHKSFGITGYPTIVLIDTQGKVVFKDHHPTFALDEAIKKLLKGEKLDYERCKFPDDLKPKLPNGELVEPPENAEQSWNKFISVSR